ncbi:MAG: phage terminase large subunit family protein [Treponema sp.]|nr:phage terminase large subunit family protein [Treponema sp.]
MTDLVEAGDVDFILESFGALTDSRSHELPSAFVERVRYLTADLTPFPGRFSFDRFPYFRKIVDCFSPLDSTQEIVLMKGNQMGATTAVLETVLLYNIMSDPKAQMYVTADAGLMRTSVQVRIEKMIDNAGARNLIFSQSRKKKGARNTGDTANAKEYPGGYLHCFGGRSPARFRGMSYPVALADEVDVFPDSIPKEGTVVDLVRNRTNAYTGSKRKILWTSTPLVKQTSNIERLYHLGDREKYFVPCKHCGTMQELVWHGEDKETGYRWGVMWENDGRFMPMIGTVGYKCQNPVCGKLMKNYDKAVIIPQGEWRATAEPLNPAVKSFHITPLYNPPGMYSWEDMVLQWAECWDIEKNRPRDKEKYRLFRNTKQGLTFEDFGMQINAERANQYRRAGFVSRRLVNGFVEIPNEMVTEDCGSPVLIVIASVDVQPDKLYVDIKGYADGGATWTLEFFEIKGKTADFNGPWDELDTVLSERRYSGTDGRVYGIQIALVDSGYNAEWVYSYAGRHYAGVYACKGFDYLAAGETYQLFSRGALERIGQAQAYKINTGKLKDRISNALMSSFWKGGEFQPAWYPNFPEDFRDDYFRMFEAESKTEVRDVLTNQFKKTVWKLKYGAANHAFDTYVYNLAALEIFAEDYCRRALCLPALNWAAFWDAARQGAFFTEGQRG